MSKEPGQGPTAPGGAPRRDDEAQPPSGARRYDSFHVRVWHRSADAMLLRVEIRHLQTDLVESATAVPLAWLCQTIRALLADDPPTGSD